MAPYGCLKQALEINRALDQFSQNQSCVKVKVFEHSNTAHQPTSQRNIKINFQPKMSLTALEKGTTAFRKLEKAPDLTYKQ